MSEATYTVTDSFLRRIIRSSTWQTTIDPPRTIDEIVDKALDLRSVTKEDALVERVYPVPESFLRALLRLATEEHYVYNLDNPKSSGLRLDKLATMISGYLDGYKNVGILCRTCQHEDEHEKDARNQYQPIWYCEGFTQLPLANGCPHSDKKYTEQFYDRVNPKDKCFKNE
jgi:hypothetical protein